MAYFFFLNSKACSSGIVSVALVIFCSSAMGKEDYRQRCKRNHVCMFNSQALGDNLLTRPSQRLHHNSEVIPIKLDTLLQLYAATVVWKVMVMVKTKRTELSIVPHTIHSAPDVKDHTISQKSVSTHSKGIKAVLVTV